MDFLVYVLICFLFALITYVVDIFDFIGAASAFFMGLVICLSTDSLNWLLVLFSFVIIGAVATRYKYREKESRGLSEKNRGIRSVGSILGNGLIPALVALMNTQLTLLFGNDLAPAVLFTTAISAAAADTLASEIGVFSKKTYLITNPRLEVSPGTEGGISFLGELAALVGATLIACFGFVFLSIGIAGVIVIVAIGFLSCQFDSILGATLETKNVIKKQDVNLLSVSLGVLLAAGFLYFL